MARWNNIELLALAHAALKVCLNHADRKSMKRRKVGEKLREEFIADSLRPINACKFECSKNYRDKRRWKGRTPEARYKKWIAIQSRIA